MNEELKQRLISSIEDERADYDKYMEMAIMANCKHIQGILMDIAKEEKTHEEILHYILEKLIK